MSEHLDLAEWRRRVAATYDALRRDPRAESARLLGYAYHPSCVYGPIWSCPLAPPENWLKVPIRAGERLAPAP